MKLVVFISLLFAVVGCRPEKTLNKKLNGEWKLSTINGEALPANYSEKLLFAKEGVEGDITITKVENGLTTVKTGIYSLLKSSTMTLAFPNNSSEYPYDTDVFEINSSTKSELKLTKTSDPKVFVYLK